MRSNGPCFAKDINTRRVDELSTEDSNGDIVKVMRKQMDEMTQKMQKQMIEMNAMMKVSKDVMRGGPGPFGTTHNATAGPVHLPGLPPTPLLPSSDGMHSPHNKKEEDLEPSRSGNPHNKNLQRTEG